MEYTSDDDLLSGPQPDLSGFLVPESASVAGFTSPGLKMKSVCPHGKKRNSCRECFNEHNASRKLQGLEPESWGIFCKHGINKYSSNACIDPKCNEKRPYTKTFVTHSGEEPQSPYQQGVIPDSARMFEPLVPKSAGLSFSSLEASEVNPIKKNLFGTRAFYSSDDDEMSQGGGRRKASKKQKKKSAKKSKKKSAKKSKKKSSRKGRKLTRR